MDVLLNTSSLRPPISGIGVYTQNLANRLGCHPDIDSIECFAPNRIPFVRTIPPSVRTSLRRIPFAYELRQRIFASSFHRKSMLAKRRVYHEPNYVSLPFHGPVVITVSDLSHIHFPHCHPKKRVAWLDRNLEPSILSCQQVICHSEFVRDELVSCYAIPRDKVNVVYHGVGADFRPSS